LEEAFRATEDRTVWWKISHNAAIKECWKTR